jgi:acetyltransferase-like isoleucine patch superfamily enzyme
MSKLKVSLSKLRAAGVESLNRPSGALMMPKNSVIEAPSSLKWTEYDHSLTLGAFSYQVSGYCFAARIGRYCSFGEEVQIGRQNHPLSWMSTSPAFYLHDKLFDLGDGFEGADDYHSYQFNNKSPATKVKITTIGNDVWIGHGAYIGAGVTIGDGAIIAAKSVVTKDVPPYGVVAGNPATLKRFRVPPHWISPMLRIKWWRYAPWQLQHLDVTEYRGFVPAIQAMNQAGEPEFEPSVVDLNDW